ncbi:MAG TPA: hypothetical protein VN549_08995, partial [Negativicutes bacterium]|nr:hypothetical protein [Negativicutes bacterium]
FYLFSAAITWIGEFLVLGLLDAYAYKPDLFHDPWAQNLLAHLLLNTTMFPAAATVMVAYSLRYGFIALVSIIFVLVEYLFVKLGLYEQHWWRYYMSAINAVAFMLIAGKWFYKMNRQRSGQTRATVFYFVALIFVHTPTPLLLLLGKQHAQIGSIDRLVGNFYRSSTIIAFAYHLVVALIFVVFVCFLKKWYWKLMPFIFSISAICIFAKMNILVFDNGWKLSYTLLIQQILIAVFILMEKYTLKPTEDHANISEPL